MKKITSDLCARLRMAGVGFAVLAAMLAMPGCNDSVLPPEFGDSLAKSIVQNPPRRNVIFVRVPGAGGSQRGGTDANQPGACWQDFAYLAAVPAGTKANQGSPSVIALDGSCELTREVRDYLRRYRPQKTYCLGTPSGLTGATTQPADELTWPGIRLPGESVESAAWTLATTFWKSADQAVLCDSNDYASALTASSLAAKLRCPLMFSDANGVPQATLGCLKHLGVKTAVLVGPHGKAAGALTEAGLKTVELGDAKAVLAWLKDYAEQCAEGEQ